MTKKEKSITAPTAKEDSSSKVDAILSKTEVSPTPITEKKRGRGRPKGSKKKGKPTYSKGKYQENIMAKAIDNFLINVTNKTILKNATDKIGKTDIEIGEALCYTLDYYGADVLGHPAIVLLMAGLSLGMVIYNKMQTIPQVKEETKTLEDKGGKI